MIGLRQNYLLKKKVFINQQKQPETAQILAEIIRADHIQNLSIFNVKSIEKFDPVLIKGVLIHLDPDLLSNV